MHEMVTVKPIEGFFAVFCAAASFGRSVRPSRAARSRFPRGSMPPPSGTWVSRRTEPSGRREQLEASNA